MKKLDKKYIQTLLPKRSKDANKGTFGKVLVIAGSDNYPGAAYLACAAAYRVGAGLVSLATIPFVKTIISRKLPELTFLSFEEVHKKLFAYDVVLLGPGLSQKDETIKLVEQLLKEKLPKTVIDGDGLNILSKIDNWWNKLSGEIILTPHPGEISRLIGLTIEEIQSDREGITKEYARGWGQTVVLKGANTVIASSDGEVRISSFANSALATAGTGDVLVGIIAGMLAQGLNFFDAACVGVYIHGMTGEVLKEKFGPSGAVASDLLPLLPGVIQHIRTSNQ